MAPRLVSCPSCRVLIKSGEAVCPRCGASSRTTSAPRISAIALGLALVSCSAGDDGDTLGGTTSTSAGSTAAETSTAGSATLGNSATSNATATSTGDDTADTNVPTTAQPPYGVPDTDDGFPGDDTTGTSGTGGETDSGDTGSSST